jgi:outer membrane murein-binding lipoprotein Lpp
MSELIDRDDQEIINELSRDGSDIDNEVVPTKAEIDALRSDLDIAQAKYNAASDDRRRAEVAYDQAYVEFHLRGQAYVCATKVYYTALNSERAI